MWWYGFFCAPSKCFSWGITNRPGIRNGTIFQSQEGHKKAGGQRRGKQSYLIPILRVSYNPALSKMNANTVIIGGPGRGKSFYVIVPNLLMCHGSLIITDTKGDLLREYGRYFEQKGYRVKSLNLCEMEKSDRYNPFRYIRKPADVSKLITNLIANTTPTEQINSAILLGTGRTIIPAGNLPLCMAGMPPGKRTSEVS